jgi:16S rRNA G1207 methylase RsmC
MPADRAAAARAARWTGRDAEQRRRETSAARRALAVKELVAAWPELTEQQQQRLRALLRPVPEGGDDHAG